VALQDSATSDVWLAKPDGSDAKQVTSGEALGFGLGWLGDRIVAANYMLQWVAFDTDGNKQTPLTHDHEPHFQFSTCPDGKHVVYTSAHNGTLELWREDSDGSNPVKYEVKSMLGGGFCTPDSQHVMYGSAEGLWRIPIEGGGTPQKVDLPNSLVAFSRDGKLALYGSQAFESGTVQSKLVVAPAEGGKPLYTFDAPYGVRQGRFTPEGKALTYLLTRNRATNIWEQPLAGGNPFQVTKFTSGEMFDYAWSKDAKQLAFSRGQSKTDVVMMSGFH